MLPPKKRHLVGMVRANVKIYLEYRGNKYTGDPVFVQQFSMIFNKLSYVIASSCLLAAGVSAQTAGQWGQASRLISQQTILITDMMV